jgi:hypothetical protein
MQHNVRQRLSQPQEQLHWKQQQQHKEQQHVLQEMLQEMLKTTTMTADHARDQGMYCVCSACTSVDSICVHEKQFTERTYEYLPRLITVYVLHGAYIAFCVTTCLWCL